MMVIIQPADQLPHVELVDGDDPPHSWDQSDQWSVWSVWSVWSQYQYDHWSLISDVAWRGQCDNISQRIQWLIATHLVSKSRRLICAGITFISIIIESLRTNHIHMRSCPPKIVSHWKNWVFLMIELWGGNLPEQRPSADQDDDHDHNGENRIQVIPEKLTIGAGKFAILIQ